MIESLEIKLARMEEKLDFLVQRVEEVFEYQERCGERIGALERDSVRTKTLFGVFGALWTLIAGMLGAWIKGAFGR